MPFANIQNLLSACAGERRVVIGREDLTELRGLSDARALTCPGCGSVLILHAGSLRAAHFAHLPGAVCHSPQTEPETPEHRAGKLLLQEWLTAQLPDAEIELEAHIPETGQRADVLIRQGKRERIALEFQCANLSAREWRRRHQAYREAGIRDLWLLGGSRLRREETDEADKTVIRTTELERALLWDGAPLLFLDSDGIAFPAGTAIRFLPEASAQAQRPTGKLAARGLLKTEFPFHLLDWEAAQNPVFHPTDATSAGRENPASVRGKASDWWLWEWLAVRHRVTKETLAPFFGLELKGNAAFGVEARLWQAAVYYRFVHRRVGDGWWLREVESWARGYLPLARPCPPRLLAQALSQFQEMLAAAGMLSLPMGYGKTNARILADLLTLPAPPDPVETQKLAGYRRTLVREARAEYKT
jgi:hypothetical protein